MKVRIYTTFLFFLAFPFFVFSQKDTIKYNEVDSLTLKELLNVKVTTASKSSEELETVPSTVIVITQEQIKSRGYQSLLDVLYDLPEVKVDDKVYSALRNSFVIRGTQGQEKFIILLDGNRISSPIDEALPIMENYPVNLAEQIEVVYGPSSALYGANAVSGVINIITKKGTGRKQTIVNATSIAGDYGYTNSTLFISQKLAENVSFTASGQYYYDSQPDLSRIYKDDSAMNVDSYRTGTMNTIFGPIIPEKEIRPAYEAPMDAYNIYASLRADNFSLSWFRNSTNTPSAYGSNVQNALYNKDAFIIQTVDMISAMHNLSFGKFRSTSTITGNDYTLDPRSNYRNLYTGMEPAYKYGAASTIKGEEQIDFLASEKLKFTAGASYEAYSVIPYSADLMRPVDPGENINASYLGTRSYYMPEGLPAKFYILKYNNIGTYFQTQYSPEEKVSITVGARYDINSRYGSTFNPRLGIVYKPFNKTTFKLIYGTAFLAPSPSTAYGHWGSFETNDSGRTFHSYFMHLPNPDLKPMTSQNIEASVNQYVLDNINFTLSGYYTTLANLNIYADDNSSTQLYHNMFNGIPVDYIEVSVNQARQQNWGGCLRMNWKWSTGRVHGNSYFSVSYVNGKVDDAATEEDETGADKALEFISPFIIKTGVDIKYGKLSFSPRIIFMGKQNVGGISETTGNIQQRQTLPGYSLLNISARYNLSRKFAVFANASNVLNQRYRSVGINMDLNKSSDIMHGQPQDPFRIMGGFNFNF